MSGNARPESRSESAIEYFLEDMTFQGKTARTRAAYERVLGSFAEFLADLGVTPAEADRRDCLAWVASLRGEHADSTVATYASYVNRFYSYMSQVGELDENPMSLVLDEMSESIDTDPERREISVERMREFVSGVRHPLERAMVLTLLKTGVRVGELCNLDLRDVALDAPVGDYELGGRAHLDGRTDALLVDPEAVRGETVNGEQRTASNKRKRVTVIPVDGELKHALVRWLAVRPDTRSPADPLFASTSDAWGERVSPEMVRNVVRRHAKRAGWYEEGASAAENVTPHYFRHFFTTHLRDRTGDRGIVKYLRGDVADDIIDTYTHNWGDRVREVYLDSIYALTA